MYLHISIWVYYDFYADNNAEIISVYPDAYLINSNTYTSTQTHRVNGRYTSVYTSDSCIHTDLGSVPSVGMK